MTTEGKTTIKIPVELQFRWATDEGAEPLRAVARHAREVSEAWASVEVAMDGLADSYERAVETGVLTVDESDLADPS